MSELVVIEQKQVPEIFKTGGIDPIIQKIKEEIGSVVYDLETEKGRKEIASAAYKVARSKTYLDKLGKDLVSTIKQQAKVIDAERKKARDELDAYADEIRAPLTEWEENEKARVASILSRCNRFTEQKTMEYSASTDVLDSILEIEAVTVDESFGEYQKLGLMNKDEALTHLKAKFIVMGKEEEEAEKLRLEEIARKEKEQKDREARIAAEAAEKAKAEAELKAKADAEKAEREAQERIEAAERKELESKLAAEAAERNRLEAEKNAKEDAIKAKEQARFEQEQAAQKERQRIEAEKQAELAAQQKREANKRHSAKINNEAMTDLIALGLDKDQAKQVVIAIATKKISHVSISY